MNTFTMVPNEIFECKLSNGAFRLYVALKSFCYGKKTACFPGQATLAAKIGKSVRTVQRGLSELSKKGIILIKRRGSTSNAYTLLKTATPSSSIETAESSSESTKENSPEIPNKACNKKIPMFFPSKKEKHSPSVFNSFPQRKYDFNKLEKCLLGLEDSLSYEDCVDYNL